MSFASAGPTGRWWQPLEPSAGLAGVAIFHADLTPSAAHEPEALAWLSGDERARHRRFLHPAPARRYALCRAALRAILCHRLDCGNGELVIAQQKEHAKPFALLRCVPAEVEFSVSHSGRHGLIAVAGPGRVGVDVEELVPLRGLELLVDSVLSPGERDGISSANLTGRTRDFLRLWTIKEALVKALGTGLSLDVAAFEVPASMLRGAESGLFRFPDSPETAWQVADLGSRDFAAAVACEVISKIPSPIGRGLG